MHTFDNGLKSATKNDNWEQLFRFFRKHSYPISRARKPTAVFMVQRKKQVDFEPVMESQNGAAIALLIRPRGSVGFNLRWCLKYTQRIPKAFPVMAILGGSIPC